MIIGRPKFVLASGSPRRLTLINQIGIEPDALRPADIDEMPLRGELPRALANRLARGKAESALAAVKLDDELAGSYILAADTVVAVGRRVLPKAEDAGEVAACLKLLSGRNHRVHTGVTLVTPKEAFRQRLIETRVRFKRLSEQDIEAYLASGARVTIRSKFSPSQSSNSSKVIGRWREMSMPTSSRAATANGSSSSLRTPAEET